MSVVEDKFRIFSRLWINRVDLIECMLNINVIRCKINFFLRSEHNMDSAVQNGQTNEGTQYIFFL